MGSKYYTKSFYTYDSHKFPGHHHILSLLCHYGFLRSKAFARDLKTGTGRQPARRYLVKSPDGHGVLTRSGEKLHHRGQRSLANALIIMNKYAMGRPGILIAVLFS